MRLKTNDFSDDALCVARRLLGVRIAWNGRAGIIVETEAYRAVDDPACHTFFRKSSRAFVADHPAGTLYVYLNYGMHWMLNFLTLSQTNQAGFVLIRALQPCAGLAAMRSARKVKQENALCSGPGKLTQALGIKGTLHAASFTQLMPTRIHQPEKIIADARIGITRATDLPWRFTDPKAKQWLSKRPNCISS